MDLFKDFNLARFVPQKDVISTSILMVVVLIYGIILFKTTMDYKKLMDTQKPDPENYSTSKIIVYILYYFSFMYIVTPIIILGINFTGNTGYVKSLSPYENIIKTQSIVLVSSLLVSCLIIYLYNLNKNNPRVIFPSVLTYSTVIFNLILVCLLAFRYYSEISEYKILENEANIIKYKENYLRDLETAENFKRLQQLEQAKLEQAKPFSIASSVGSAASSVASGISSVASGISYLGSSIKQGYSKQKEAQDYDNMIRQYNQIFPEKK